MYGVFTKNWVKTTTVVQCDLLINSAQLEITHSVVISYFPLQFENFFVKSNFKFLKNALNKNYRNLLKNFVKASFLPKYINFIKMLIYLVKVWKNTVKCYHAQKFSVKSTIY